MTATTETTVAAAPKGPKSEAKPKSEKAAKKAPAAAPKGKKAKAAPEPKVEKAEKGPMDLTGNEALILTALGKAKTALSRDELRKATKIDRGWSRILGAGTKEDGGVNAENSLEGRGLVVHEKNEGERVLRYSITAKGRKALAAANA